MSEDRATVPVEAPSEPPPDGLDAQDIRRFGTIGYELYVAVILSQAQVLQ